SPVARRRHRCDETVTARAGPSASARLASMDRDARTVLVVEDEPHIRDLVGLHLELEGWTPEPAGDGHVALDPLRARPFDLVVLDIMLPGLDGLTVLKALRRDSRNTDVPVLLLTARREESDKVL